MAEVRMNLLLMGKTGMGKSSTGNTILGRKCFKEYSSMASGTKGIHYNTGRFGDYVISVVDPPGLMDTETVGEEQAQRAEADMFEALMWCGGGIDAFVFVMRYGTRFTEEDRMTLEILKSLFGENYFSHLIVVLTLGDSFTSNMEHEGTPEKSFDTWCKEQRGSFKQLLVDCNGRFVLFNNREKDEVKMRAQRQQLFQLVKDLQRNNGKYTSETFEDAEELREIFILKQKAPLLQKDILARIDLLFIDIQSLTDTPQESEIEHIKQGIENLRSEIEKADKGTGVFQPLMQNVAQLQENLHDKEELKRLVQEFHTTQISETERMAMLTRNAYTTFVIAATVVGAPIAAVYGAGTAMYAFVLKIHNNRRFKTINSKIKDVRAKLARFNTKKR